MHEFIICMSVIVLAVATTTSVLLVLIGAAEGFADLIDHGHDDRHDDE